MSGTPMCLSQNSSLTVEEVAKAAQGQLWWQFYPRADLGAGRGFQAPDMGGSRDYSPSLSEAVDREVRALIEQAHTEAWQVLNTNRDVLDRLAGELLEKETLDHVRLATIFAEVEKLPERPQWLSHPDRPVSDRPPIELPVSQHVDEVVEPDVETEPAS